MISTRTGLGPIAGVAIEMTGTRNLVATVAADHAKRITVAESPATNLAAHHQLETSVAEIGLATDLLVAIAVYAIALHRLVAVIVPGLGVRRTLTGTSPVVAVAASVMIAVTVDAMIVEIAQEAIDQGTMTAGMVGEKGVPGEMRVTAINLAVEASATPRIQIATRSQSEIAVGAEVEIEVEMIEIEGGVLAAAREAVVVVGDAEICICFMF